MDCKEEIIQIILKSETKQQVNNGLLKLYSDGTVVSHIYKTIQPLISELPGKEDDSNELPINIYNQVVGTQHRPNMNALQKFISKS